MGDCPHAREQRFPDGPAILYRIPSSLCMVTPHVIVGTDDDAAAAPQEADVP